MIADVGGRCFFLVDISIPPQQSLEGAVRSGLRARADCQVSQRMSAPAVLSDCFGAGALSLKGRGTSPIDGSAGLSHSLGLPAHLHGICAEQSRERSSMSNPNGWHFRLGLSAESIRRRAAGTRRSTENPIVFRGTVMAHLVPQNRTNRRVSPQVSS